MFFRIMSAKEVFRLLITKVESINLLSIWKFSNFLSIMVIWGISIVPGDLGIWAGILLNKNNNTIDKTSFNTLYLKLKISADKRRLVKIRCKCKLHLWCIEPENYQITALLSRKHHENIYFGRSSDLSCCEAFPFSYRTVAWDSQHQNGLYSCGYSSGFSPDSLFIPHLETKILLQIYRIRIT